MKHFLTTLNKFFTRKGRNSFYLTLFYVGLLIFCTGSFSNAQSIVVNSVTNNNICAGTSLTVNFTRNQPSNFNNSSRYTVFLSDASGTNFMALPAATDISINANSINVTIPPNTPAGLNYKVAISSTSPTVGITALAGVFAVRRQPTLSSLTQVGVACSGAGATISVAGLIPGATSTISYRVQGTGNPINVDVLADATGVATFTSVTSVSANQTINVSTVSSNGCSQSSTVKSSALTFNPAPALTGASQSAQAVCAGSGAVINLTGLGSNSTSTVHYTINGIPYQRTNVVATGTNASFTTEALTAANDGQILKITGITRTDLSSACFRSFNFDIKLTVSPYINKIIAADPASVCVLNSSVIKVFAPDPRVRYQLRNDQDSSLVGVPVTSIISPLNIPIPKGYLTGNTTFNIVATDTITGCSAELLTKPTITVKTSGVTYPVANIAAEYCNLGNGNVLLSSVNTHTSYLWNNDSTQSSIVINQAGIYTLTVTDGNGCRADTSVNIGDEQVINGNFNLGVGIGYSSEYQYNATPGGLFAPGTGHYAINKDAKFTHINFWGKDHTTQTGNFMIVNGTAGRHIWTTKVKVIPNTRYFFSAWAMSMNAVGPFARLQFNVNGINVGSVAALAAGISGSSNNGWTRFHGFWDSGSNNDSISIRIVNLENSPNGNDFGLDDISFSKLPPVSFFGTTLGNGGNSVCTGDTLTLTATLTGGFSPFKYNWSGPNGFSSTAVSPAILTAPGGWYYSTIEDANKCPRKDSILIIRGDPTLNTLTLSDACSSSIVVVANLGGMVANSINNTVFYKIANGPRRIATNVNVDAVGNASFIVAGVGAINNGNLVSVDSVFNGSCMAKLFPSSKTAPIVIKGAGEWIGGAAGNWNVNGNWCGGIPAGGANIQVPTGSVITVPPGYITNSVNNLTVNGTLILKNSTLRITNTINKTPGGIFDATSGTLELAGNALQSISGKSFLNNAVNGLVISNAVATGVNVTDSLNILDTLAFTVSNATLNTGDNIVFTSNAANTARLTDITRGGNISGNKIVGKVTVERFYPASRAWRLITTPLSNTGSIFTNWQNNGVYEVGKGMFITGPNPTGSTGNGLDFSHFNNFSMRSWNAATSSYISVGNTKETLLSDTVRTPGKAANIGYYTFVRGDRSRNPDNTSSVNKNKTTLSSKGNLQTGTQTFDIPTGAGTFALIGNPYVSAVNFAEVTKNNVNPYKFFVYDPSLNVVGGFVTMDDFDQNGVFEPTPHFSTQTSHIQSSQAFFVEVTGGGASVTFNENDKTTDYNPALFRPARATAKIQALRVNLLQVNDGNNAKPVDGTFVGFDEQYNDKVDVQDALKFTNINENLSILRHKQFLTVERRPLITENDTLVLNLSRTTRRNYRFSIEPTNFPPNVTAFLEDSFTKLSTPINMLSPSIFDFAITTDANSSLANRFRIVFKQAALGPLPVTFKAIKANEQNGDIAVHWTVENEINIKHYEVERSADGIAFSTVNITTATGANRNRTDYKMLDVNPLSGNNFYRIRSIGLDGTFDYSSTVLVKSSNLAGGIRIYPNPVTDFIGAEFKNMSAGMYTARLLNALGQTVLTKTINHASGTSMENIKPDYKLSSGIYQLEITAPDKQITMVKVIVK